ncbi:MAG: indolepyruvate oxidoreductase subunit beta [Candidatus Aminicenantes bacterium]|nr:indolepyruvate oxidoreductase subunit beta [Candidatus Aminicenantes bacterium]
MGKETRSVIIAGVGGQGILLASNLLSEAAMEAGYDVKKSEIHGMSQRGGDVISTVRFGDKVYSPIVGLAGADVILAFEKLEALRNLPYLKKEGTIIVNDYRIDPLPVASGYMEYPENTIEYLKERVKTIVLDAKELALKAGNIRTMNVVLLGVLSKSLDIPEDIWLKVIERRVPPKAIEANKIAFRLGREVAENAEL